MNFNFNLKIFRRHKARHHLKKLQKVLRHKHHPLIHKIHHVHRISKKTLFYVKEYGAHTNVPKTILKESLRIIILASIISSVGGLALEQIKALFLTMLPLVILLPALNDMVGDYGSIIASRFSTMLHKGEVQKQWWKEQQVKVLFWQVFIIAIITAILCATIALLLSKYTRAPLLVTPVFALKILLITLFDVIILVGVLFIVTIFAGIYIFKKKEDPNNFLIPITTSIADFGNMVVLAALVLLFF